MPQFSYITANLKDYERDGSVIVYATDGNKVHPIRVKGFLFHFFVREEDYIPDCEEIKSVEYGYVHKDGFPLKRINVTHPKWIKPLRKQLMAEFNIESFEGDIPPVRQLKIDTGIFNDFEIKSPNFSTVHYTDLKPIDLKSIFTVRKVYIDFEIRTKTRFPDPKRPDQPCTAWCGYSTTNQIYYQAVLKEDLAEEHITEWIKDDWCCVWCKTEKTLLQAFDIFLRTHQPYVIVHYNGKVADVEYPKARAKLYNIHLPYDESDECDLCLAYQTLYKRLYNRLKDIAIEEGILEPWQLVAEEYHSNMEKEDIHQFGAYNKLDVEILVTLDLLGWMQLNSNDGTKTPEPPRQIVDFFWELRNFIGLESIGAALHSGVLVDTLMLRKAHENGYVLNSSPDGEGERYPGAIIFSPPAGLYEYMQLLDMSRYYPNIILGYKIDPLACEVVTDLMAKRENVEAEQKKYEPDSPSYKLWEKKLNMVKYTTNATYGYMGSPRSRMYKRDKAARITEKARLGLITIREAVEAKTPELLIKLKEHTGFDCGFPVLYSHTDSIGIQASREEIKKLVWYLNEIVLKEHCQREGIPPTIKLKHEKEARRVIFIEAKSGKGSAKARHAMWITYEKGQEADYIDIVGLDYVRGNASKITRKLQMTILRGILKDGTEDIKPYIRNLMKDIKTGKYSLTEMAIPITLKYAPEDYAKRKSKSGKKPMPYFVKASFWSMKNLGMEIVGGDRVKVIPVTRVVSKEPTNLIAFFDEENLHGLDIRIDYNEIIRKTVRAKAEQFLSVVGITWDEVLGVEKLSRWKFA